MQAVRYCQPDIATVLTRILLLLTASKPRCVVRGWADQPFTVGNNNNDNEPAIRLTLCGNCDYGVIPRGRDSNHNIKLVRILTIIWLIDMGNILKYCLECLTVNVTKLPSGTSRVHDIQNEDYYFINIFGENDTRRKS